MFQKLQNLLLFFVCVISDLSTKGPKGRHNPLTWACPATAWLAACSATGRTAGPGQATGLILLPIRPGSRRPRPLPGPAALPRTDSRSRPAQHTQRNRLVFHNFPVLDGQERKRRCFPFSIAFSRVITTPSAKLKSGTLVANGTKDLALGFPYTYRRCMVHTARE